TPLMATRSLELRWSFLLAGLAAAVLGYAAASLGGGPPAWVGAAGALALAGALWGLGGWVDRRLAEPVKAAGLIASRVAGRDVSGPHQARGGAGAARPCRGGRRRAHPPDRHHPRRGGGGLGTPQQQPGHAGAPP